MANVNIKESELKAILAEVSAEIDSFLKSEGEKLSKAQNDDEKDESPAPEASASAPSAPAQSEGSPAPDAETPGVQPGEAMAPSPAQASPQDEPAPETSADAAAQGQEPAEGPGGEAGEIHPGDPEALKAEYAKLPVEELKQHYLAAREALFEAMGGGEGQGEQSPSAPAPGPAASPSMSPSPAPAMKSEHGTADGSGKSLPVKKSEEPDKLADLQGQVATLAKALDIILSTPERKAITGISEVKAQEAPKVDVSKLTMGEVTAKLKEVTSNPTLAKSERELINKFYGGTVDIEKIAHLLA